MSYTRTCIGCGNPFDTDNFRRQRCHKHCGRTTAIRNPTRQLIRDTHDVEFVAVDGEGVTDEKGDHHYVLLSVGDQSYHRDGRHLHHDEVFEFLYDQYVDYPDAAFVGFFLGYDFTQWLRTLTANRAAMLLSPQGIAARAPRAGGNMRAPFMVQIGHEWQIDVLAAKRFKLRPYSPPGAKPAPTMYICDAGPFFQSSLLKVLDPKDWPAGEYPISDDDYRIILEGKNNRSSAQFDTDMIRYNVTENRALSQIMSNLNSGFVEAGVKLKRNQWFGPGQAASAWLSDHCDHYTTTTEQHLGLRDIVPQEVLTAATGAYYGGWFEIYAHGHVPGISYEYDINSAYPYSIARLPCLLHGTWTQPRRAPAMTYEPMGGAPWQLVHGTVVTDHTIMGGMPSRSKTGTIFRPAGVTGWHWLHEVNALARIPGVNARFSQVDQLGPVWTYQPCACPSPMRAIRELYEQRIALGPKGKNSPAGKALKLLYNSMYGKFAQSVGSPKFANPIWASLITSLTRTQILDAIATHPNGANDLLMVATDAVYFRTRHPDLDLSPTALGAWDETQRHNITLMMPGVYWDDVTRAAFAAGDAPKLKSRGISAAALSACITQLDDQFAAFDPVATPAHHPDAWPTADIPLPFTMVSATLAVARHNWASAGTVSTTDTKQLSSWPMAKRDPTTVWWDQGVLRTGTYHSTWESVPYQKSFGMDLSESKNNDMLTPDGDITTLLAEAFRE